VDFWGRKKIERFPMGLRMTVGDQEEVGENRKTINERKSNVTLKKVLIRQ
jgi:hypothetical protein